ncbi:unnamed protein product [Phytophthora lilii]|uniref:Unnamed protein product n=1 Tax=Phytophthora lilii TaxID=2077276 RepID=A0A9W6UAX4_9STRA|nr:unnamed protein product [Phytophthora lilii]
MARQASKVSAPKQISSTKDLRSKPGTNEDLSGSPVRIHQLRKWVNTVVSRSSSIKLCRDQTRALRQVHRVRTGRGDLTVGSQRSRLRFPDDLCKLSPTSLGLDKSPQSVVKHTLIYHGRILQAERHAQPLKMPETKADTLRALCVIMTAQNPLAASKEQNHRYASISVSRSSTRGTAYSSIAVTAFTIL